MSSSFKLVIKEKKMKKKKKAFKLHPPSGIWKTHNDYSFHLARIYMYLTNFIYWVGTSWLDPPPVSHISWYPL